MALEKCHCYNLTSNPKLAEIQVDLLEKHDFISCTFIILRKSNNHDAEQLPK